MCISNDLASSISTYANLLRRHLHEIGAVSLTSHQGSPRGYTSERECEGRCARVSSPRIASLLLQLLSIFRTSQRTQSEKQSHPRECRWLALLQSPLVKIGDESRLARDWNWHNIAMSCYHDSKTQVVNLYI